MKPINAQITQYTKIAEGGEAEIFRLASHTLAKIFKPKVDLAAKKAKLEYIMQATLPANCSAPVELLSQSGKFLGYSMQEIDGKPLGKLSSRKFVLAAGINLQQISKMLMNLHNSLLQLHGFCCIGDLNELNVLFKGEEVFLIDVDSWHFKGFPCNVSHPLFADPTTNDFSKLTDYYSFAVIAFKALTRIHPFGGSYNNLDILQRIDKRISVLDSRVKVAPNIAGWRFLPPDLLQDFEKIFRLNERFLIDISDFAYNLKFCSKHNDYYYSEYSQCPVCYDQAVAIVIASTPTAIEVQTKLLLAPKGVKLIFDKYCWLMQDDTVYFPNTNEGTWYEPGTYYYYMDCNTFDANIVTEYANYFTIGKAKFEKQHGSRISVGKDAISYVSPNGDLMYIDSDNSERKLAECSFRHLFEVYDKQVFFICNTYDDFLIIDSNSYMRKLDPLPKGEKITDYCIQFDEVSKHWLFIYSTNTATKTMVWKLNSLIYESSKIDYAGPLGNIMHYNGTIYIPKAGKIVGFNYQTGMQKEFICNVVTGESKISLQHLGLIIQNEKEIYLLSGGKT